MSDSPSIEIPEEIWKYILSCISFTQSYQRASSFSGEVRPGEVALRPAGEVALRPAGEVALRPAGEVRPGEVALRPALGVYQKNLVLVCHMWQNILDNLDYWPIPNPSTITLKLIDRYSQQFNWHHISANYRLSEQFIIHYLTHIDIMYILISQNISETLIEQHFTKFSPYLLQLKELSEGFLERHIGDLDFVELVMTQILSPRFIRKYYENCQDKDMCELLIIHQNLPSDVEIKFHKVIKNNNYGDITCKGIILVIIILSLISVCIILFYIGTTYQNVIFIIAGIVVAILVFCTCILIIKND